GGIAGGGIRGKGVRRNPSAHEKTPCLAGVSLPARMTGLEPATSGVTGRCSNQLSYIPKYCQLGTCVESWFLRSSISSGLFADFWAHFSNASDTSQAHCIG